MEQEYFTIPEVADRLKVTPAAIRKWIAQGKIEVVYVGADRRITGAAIEAFVRNSTEARKNRRLDKADRSDLQSSDTRSPSLVAA